MGRSGWRLGRNTRWLLAVPALLFAFFPKPAQAEVLPGLRTVYYEIDEIPPIQSETEYSVCGLEVENNINRSYDGEPFEDCTYDFFMVQMTGFITIPEHETIEFWLASDDGGEATIGGNTFGRWADQGCSATVSGPLELESGVHPLEVWMYEHGGGTCLMLAWKIDDGYWEIVPEWAFTTGYTPPTTTTTTTAPPETVPVTTATSTTLQETSTTVETTTSYSSSTLVDQSTSTTTEPTTSSTSSSSSTTTEPTTSTAPSSTTSTTSSTTTTTTQAPQPVWVPTATTTTEASTTTTTTSEPPIETTIPVQTTEPVSTTVAPQTTIPATTSSIASTTSLSVPDTTIPTTTIPETATTIPTIQPGISNQQALQQVTNPSVVESLSTAQAEVLFAALDEESVTDDQASLIIQALDDAPDEVKEAFEENVNVFSGIWSSYKMVGQTITVAERVTLVAVANTMGAATAVLRRRNGE